MIYIRLNQAVTNHLIQGCRHWWKGVRGGGGGTEFSGAKIFFLRKIGVDEKLGVDKKSHKKWHRKEGVQPKK